MIPAPRNTWGVYELRGTLLGPYCKGILLSVGLYSGSPTFGIPHIVIEQQEAALQALHLVAATAPFPPVRLLPALWPRKHNGTAGRRMALEPQVCGSKMLALKGRMRTATLMLFLGKPSRLSGTLNPKPSVEDFGNVNTAHNYLQSVLRIGCAIRRGTGNLRESCTGQLSGLGFRV